MSRFRHHLLGGSITRKSYPDAPSLKLTFPSQLYINSGFPPIHSSVHHRVHIASHLIAATRKKRTGLAKTSIFQPPFFLDVVKSTFATSRIELRPHKGIANFRHLTVDSWLYSTCSRVLMLCMSPHLCLTECFLNFL